jgi:hypothetical protein
VMSGDELAVMRLLSYATACSTPLP